MWPRYQTGYHDSMHALGVVSVNFANFERAVTWILAAVAKTSEDDARVIQLRDGTTACAAKIEKASRARAWSGIPDDRVRHFVAAMKILIENRNLLMHCVVIPGPNDSSTLYRMSKRGDRQMVQTTIDQIRAVADDLHCYFEFALALANCIAVKVDGADQQVGTIVFHDWPEEPPTPTPLFDVLRTNTSGLRDLLASRSRTPLSTPR